MLGVTFLTESPDRDALSAVLLAWMTGAHFPLSIVKAGEGFPFIYVNPAFEASSGYRAAEILGRDVRSLAPDDSPGTQHAIDHALETGLPSRGRTRQVRADGSDWWSELHVFPVVDAEGLSTHVVGLQFDVTDQVAAEQRLVHTTTHDSLTGLVTRAHFLHSLDREIARSRRDRSSLAVLFLDVDRLKATNDAHGHAAGDALLVELSRRLRGRLRAGDLTGRFGGDEFLVRLVGLPEETEAAAAITGRVVGELTSLLSEPVDVGPVEQAVSVSIGTAIYPHDAVGAADLIAFADAHMYRQKPAG